MLQQPAKSGKFNHSSNSVPATTPPDNISPDSYTGMLRSYFVADDYERYFFAQAVMSDMAMKVAELGQDGIDGVLQGFAVLRRTVIWRSNICLMNDIAFIEGIMWLVGEELPTLANALARKGLRKRRLRQLA